eukprot:8501213-Pyramimonas_sp.AAC.1
MLRLGSLHGAWVSTVELATCEFRERGSASATSWAQRSFPPVAEVKAADKARGQPFHSHRGFLARPPLH